MKIHKVDLQGYEAELPILPLPSGIGIAFFNLHGNSEMTEHCGKKLAEKLTDCDVLITAESKGLQLTHCVARELGQKYYAVARKSKKLYMQDGIEITIESSITTGKEQKMYLSKHDADLLKGKKVGIVDDVVSTGASLAGLEKLVLAAGGIIHKKAFVLAEAEAADREDVVYLATIPIFPNFKG
ncbi:MAG: adenine phosphoribosyltransferase [Clostridia bacterium]|nr:adenine phosphoribosyltransferase [Clostridia bacterium]